jgi:hypothetical protein
LFQVLIDVRVADGSEVPELFLVMQQVWENLEKCMLPMLDRRGTDPDMEFLKTKTVEFIDYVNTVTIGGVRVFSAAYITISFHQLLHMPQMVSWWGNIWEYWCFVFERIAGVYTQLIRRFNDRGQLSNFLFNRLALRDISASRVHVAKSGMSNATAQQFVSDLEEAQMDTIVVPDGPVDEGQLWSDLHSKGLLRSRVVAPYALNTSGRKDRGLVVTYRLFQNMKHEWHRINLLSIDSINLTTRTLSQVRAEPWSMNAIGLDRRLCGVLVDFECGAGLQVLLVDGGAKLAIGDPDQSKVSKSLLSQWPDRSKFPLETGQWELVGCLLGTPTQGLKDTCSKVTLPTDGVFQLRVFPVASLRRLIGLIRVDSNSLECLVVNPNENFLMIPLTPGVMRTMKKADGQSVKGMDFLGMASISRCHAANVDQNHHNADLDQDLEDPDPDGWAGNLSDIAGELGIDLETVTSLQLMSALKPAYSQPAGILNQEVCKELHTPGVARVWCELLEYRRSVGLPVEDLTFVDLGSGIGGVVIATLILHPNVVSSACGIEIHADLHENMQQWLRSAGKQWPWLKHCTQLLEGNMINGDFTRDDRVSEVLKKADVVFVNNYLFDPQTGINPVVSRAPSLNQKLQALLCANLSSNATVLTTSKLTDSRRGGPPRGQVSQKRLLVTHKSFPLKPSDVSWGGKLRVYISSASTL